MRSKGNLRLLLEAIGEKLERYVVVSLGQGVIHNTLMRLPFGV